MATLVRATAMAAALRRCCFIASSRNPVRIMAGISQPHSPSEKSPQQLQQQRSYRQNARNAVPHEKGAATTAAEFTADYIDPNSKSRKPPAFTGYKQTPGWTDPGSVVGMPPWRPEFEQWSETAYLDFLVGLEPQGPTALGGTMLGDVWGPQRRLHPGPAARDFRSKLESRIEGGASPDGRRAILNEKVEVFDIGGFWIPFLVDLMGGLHHGQSVEVFEWMIARPDIFNSATAEQVVVLFSIMISYAGAAEKIQVARKWFDFMGARGMPKSGLCFNALMMAYAKAKDVDTAMAIFNSMKDVHQDCPPTVLSYYILIAMYARIGDWQNAEAMVTACKNAGFTIDARTYSTLLCVLAKLNKPELFESILEEAKQIARSPNQVQHENLKFSDEIYSAMLVGYSRLGNPDKAVELLREIVGAENAGAVPIAAIDEIAMSYCTKGQKGTKEALGDELLKLVKAVEPAELLSKNTQMVLLGLYLNFKM